MADLPERTRIVIIGGGAVGASTLYHLALAGETDVVLLEKNELTAGSTWHAAGNCPTFSGSWAVMQMQAYSAELFETLGEATGYPINYHRTGSIRIAHTVERMREFHHVADMAASQGRALDVLSVEQLGDYIPFMETHDLVGGLWDALDGDIDPSQMTQAYARGARNLGARVVRFCPVTDVDREGGDWVLTTPQGQIRAEIVVNAAGYYAQELSKKFIPFGGRLLPQTVMAHQYLITEEIPELAAADTPMPLLRDPDSSYYLRQEKNALLLGPYEKGGRNHWLGGDDVMPDDFSFQLFNDDLDRIADYIEDACARIPYMGTAGLTRVINGPIPYAPDGNPLVGPMPGVPNAFEACTFTFGIIQSGGAGKCMAEWILEGETEWDTWALDPRRFTGYADQAYADVKGKEIYDNEYATHFPHLQWPEGRNKRLSPLHDRLAGAGAQFGAFGGWERAVWFAGDGDNTDWDACATYDREGPWYAAAKREAEAVRDAAGLIDLTGFSRYELSGPGAADWLDTQTASRLPSMGRLGLAYFATPKGRFKTEMSVARLAEDHFLLLSAAAAEWHDYEWLARDLPQTLTLTNTTSDMATLLLTGPKARDILGPLIEADLTQAWLTHQTARFNGAEFLLMRVSYAGELGWELHVPPAMAGDLWDAMMAAGAPMGLRPLGMYALDSLRLEKGYMSWHGDLTSDYSLLELNLGRFIALDKPSFTGRAALLAEHQGGVKQRLRALSLPGAPIDAAGLSGVFSGNDRVGLTTSANFGHRVGGPIALAMVAEGATEDLSVEIFGTRTPAVLSPSLAQFDPKNERLRA